MELSWTTFVLESINFLVLVWLLKRLFYAPVKKAIAQRRSAVEKTLQDAKSLKQEAEELNSQYQGRLQKWEEEKARQQEELRKEITAEKARQLKGLETSLVMERQMAWLVAFNDGLLDDLTPARIHPVLQNLFAWTSTSGLTLTATRDQWRSALEAWKKSGGVS